MMNSPDPIERRSDMDIPISKMINKTKMNLIQAAAYVKQRIDSLTGTQTATIEQLAAYIQYHPDTKKRTKNLLGLSFSFFTLDQGDVHYKLETKGSDILQLDVRTLEHHVVSYRSYRDQNKLNAPIRFFKLTI
ncbi:MULTISPECIES: hypothetical protein [Metabacillus]|uniref:Uncharacterized protein n=1 Tax=Metabacillus hrfriensis TaxID=3048891 RepID=A0ACD4R5A9_9BACI|nr:MULTISPECIES: hypothetical protein [Metabacillus]UAL50150.1 hypothetical protein K8L98_12750 [Metabacillus dongyingensis]USK26392.1 hypothetical protein LIT32_12750 [Bacillus sp. CMF21]WHZ55614.1 hypothetical protein QLQ22_12825 [Metabacillus sp. CT-WN-B3]